MAHASIDMLVEEEMAKYDNFDMETYALRKEQQISAGLRGDTHYKAPIASSWLMWRVKMPDVLATITIAVLAAYEVMVVVSMFVENVRYVMVEGGIMWVLSAFNMFLVIMLGGVVLVTRFDWNLGMLTGKLSRARPSSQSENDD